MCGSCGMICRIDKAGAGQVTFLLFIPFFVCLRNRDIICFDFIGFALFVGSICDKGPTSCP